MVVQTPYGIRANTILDKLIEELNRCELVPETYTRVMPSVFVRMFDARGLMRGCPLNGEACTYTVLACKYVDQQTCEVCMPNQSSGAMMQYWCDIPLSLRVAVSAQRRNAGFGFFSRVENTGFYQIEFGYANSFLDSYSDGDVYYEVGPTSIPVTQGAIKQRVIYVKSDTCPKVFSANRGINVINLG